MVIGNGSSSDISSANSGLGSALVNELPACCPGSPPICGWFYMDLRGLQTEFQECETLERLCLDNKHILGGLRFTYRMTRISIHTVMTSDIKGLSMHRSLYTSV